MLPRSQNTLELLDGSYRLFADYQGSEALIAHVHHVDRKGKHGFGVVETPVGQFVAHMHPGNGEGLLPHWSARLFLRSDLRYEKGADKTTVVGDPRQIAGPNETLLLQLIALRDSSLPSAHPGLPAALGRALIDSRWCSEPMVLYIDQCTTNSYIQFGQAFDAGA